MKTYTLLYASTSCILYINTVFYFIVCEECVNIYIEFSKYLTYTYTCLTVQCAIENLYKVYGKNNFKARSNVKIVCIGIVNLKISIKSEVIPIIHHISINQLYNIVSKDDISFLDDTQNSKFNKENT